MSKDKTSAQDNGSLVAAATMLLEGGNAKVKSRSLQRDVICRPAKLHQLTVLLDLFETLVNRLDAENLGALVEMVADAQRDKLKEGGDPNALPYAEMSAVQIIDRAKERVSVVTLLMNALLMELPNIVAAFSDVTTDEYQQLDLDEGVEVLLAIFTVNYSFFTQSLPRTFSAYMQTWASKNPEKTAIVRAVIKRTASRR